MTNIKAHINQDETLRETAAAWFLRRCDGEVDEVAFADWLDADPSHARAYREIETAWGVVGAQATAPELVTARRDALDRVQQYNQRRWGPARRRRYGWAAGLAATVLIATGAAWFLQLADPFSGTDVYQTGIGEQRVITLADNSRVSLDALTHLRVDYNDSARRIELLNGQAHFDVARDVLRPFSVHAGDQTVVALGTQFNVEIVDEQILVTLLKGRVEVSADPVRSNARSEVSGSVTRIPDPIELVPGQQLVVASNGTREPIVEADVQRTVSWRQGKLMFEDEPLADAVARVNRHSHIRVQLADDAVHDIKISGVFDAGDTDAFVEAVESLFPVDAAHSNGQSVTLRATND